MGHIREWITAHPYLFAGLITALVNIVFFSSLLIAAAVLTEGTLITNLAITLGISSLAELGLTSQLIIISAITFTTSSLIGTIGASLSWLFTFELPNKLYGAPVKKCDIENPYSSNTTNTTNIAISASKSIAPPPPAPPLPPPPSRHPRAKIPQGAVAIIPNNVLKNARSNLSSSKTQSYNTAEKSTQTTGNPLASAVAAIAKNRRDPSRKSWTPKKSKDTRDLPEWMNEVTNKFKIARGTTPAATPKADRTLEVEWSTPGVHGGNYWMTPASKMPKTPLPKKGIERAATPHHSKHQDTSATSHQGVVSNEI